MTTRAILSLSLTLLLPVLFACPDDGPEDAGLVDSGADAGEEADTGVDEPDAGEPDTGAEVDGGEVDAGEPDSGEEPDAGMVEDDFRVPGLSGPVEVRFDDYGMLHLRCDSDLDCFAVQGYFHAAHRFGQMDFRRRAARGKLSELYGSGTLPTDLVTRSVIATQDGSRLEEQLWASTDAETQAMIEAYTRGVNAWIADLRAGRNGAQLTQENVDRGVGAIEDWEVLDSAACALVLVLQLTDQSADELGAGALFAALPPAAAFDLFGLTPASPSTILPPPASFVGASEQLSRDLEQVQSRLRQVQASLSHAPKKLDLGLAGDSYGSNNWVVSASQAAGTAALLANDPHLGFSNPSVWYLVSIDSKTAGQGGTIHVAGSSFAGLPGILIGQNEDLAWGLTTTFFDMSDVYTETTNAAGTAVLYNEGEVPFVERTFEFEVAGQAPVSRTVRYVPHHGPVIVPDVYEPDQPSLPPISLRWTGQDADTDLNFILRLMRATSVAEARDDALSQVTTIGQNFVIADKAGDIAWLPYNRLPQRPFASAALPPWLPLPGDGSAEWAGTIPYADLPQVVNPPAGFVATANNDMTGALQDGDPTNDSLNGAMQTFLATGFRHERITELLVEGAPNHTSATMSAMQADVHVLLGERVVPTLLADFILTGVGPSASGQKVIDALAAWQYTCPTGLETRDTTSPKVTDSAEAAESIGCSAFHALWTELIIGTFDDEILAADPTAEEHARPEALVRLLTRPGTLLGGESYWDDVGTAGQTEGRYSTVLAAIERAATFLESTLGPDPDDWRWGRIHTITLFADVYGNTPITRFNNGPWANDGGWYTVDVANPTGHFGGSYAHGSGPSMRFVCEVPSTGPACTMQIPGGQRNRPGEDHYEDLFLLWLENQSIPLPFLPADIDAATQELITVRAP